MIRKYRFEWAENKRKDLVRTNIITPSSATGITAVDAKNAVGLFTKAFGSLTKNTIFKIQELDENGEQIGEDITPTSEEKVIAPTRRRGQ